MRKTNLIVLLLLAGALLTASAGCSTVAGEIFGLFKGAKGVYAPIKPLAVGKETRPLGDYRRFEIGKITDDFGGKVPSTLMTRFEPAFEELLEKARIPNEPSGKTLLIRGKFLHYEDAGTVGIMIGPLEQVLARIELVDKSSGRVLGVANCIGRTEDRVNVGVKKKAEGLAKAIASWIDSRFPEGSRLPKKE